MEGINRLNKTFRARLRLQNARKVKASISPEATTIRDAIALIEEEEARTTKGMNNRIIAALIFVSLILGSCQEQPFYEKSYEFKNSVWGRDQKPLFKVDIKDKNKEYDFIITLRTTTDYKFNNLWIFLNTTTPSGIRAREPFEIRIANPDGSWAGKKTGTVVEFPLNFKRRKMPEQGTYTFALEQGITESEIDEVLDVGLRVEEVKTQK